MSVSRPLRIAYLHGSLEIGGAERQMLALARGLPKDRFETTFVLLTHRGPFAVLAEQAGARVEVIGWTRKGSVFRRPRWLLDLIRTGRALGGGRYDIVDAWSVQGYQIAAFSRPISRVRVLLAGRRRLSDFKLRYRWPEKLADAIARRSADAFVAVSESVRADVVRVERIDPRAIRVIRVGVEPSSLMAPAERDTIRARWGYSPDEIVVGCVANYRPRKGLEMLLRVAADLCDAEPRLRYVLVGEGPLRQVLEKTVGELGLASRVVLHGSEPDARTLYGAFDIVAHPSESEGGPNAVVEAAAAGRAIVATAAGGTTEAVVDGESGLLVPVGDAPAFAAALRRVAGDEALRARLGAAATERATRVFGMERLISETAALYEELAARKGVRR